MICKCETLNITEKNDEQILVTVMRGFEQEASENESEGAPQPFPVEISTDIDVKLTTPRAQRLPIDFTVGDEGIILIDLKADRVKAGTTYGIEVTGVVNGSRWCAIGDSVIRITRRTERGPKQVKVDADPYEVTLWAGYVGDVVPRHLRDLDGYAALTQLLDAMGETLGKKADAEDVTNALRPIIDRFANYIPTSQKGQANGVASLDAAGKILASALNMPWRGNFTGNFQASNIAPGIYGVDDRKIGPNPLNGENAHGVMLVFPDRYKTTLFLVGRPNGSQYGNAPEIYARRWLETANSWTSWFTTANYAKRDEIPTVPEYTLTKTGNNIELRKNGAVLSQVADANTTYTAMSQTEAETGTATSARTMSAKVLKSAIVKHTENKATTDFVNSSIQTATASFRGTHDSLEELQAVEGADRNDYGYVIETDAVGNKIIHRYKYVEGTGWLFEYDLNPTGFTAAEWQAIKSGITPEDVEKLRELPEKDAVMPLTRMTDELLNPDECLEPGVYENVQFPDVANSIEIPTPVTPTAKDDFYVQGYSGTKCTLYTSRTSKLHFNEKDYLGNIIYQEEDTLLQVAIGLELAYGHPANMMGVGNYIPNDRGNARIALRIVRKMRIFDNTTITIGVPGSPPPPTPEPKYVYLYSPWLSMASFLDLKSTVERIKQSYALKSDTLDRYKVGEEVLVGEWTEDGVTYDLYRKVVSFGNLPNAGQKTVAHGIANKVKFTRVAAMASNGFPIPFVTQDASKAIYLSLGNNQITINTHATDRSALTADVTIEFTRAKE